MVCPSLQEFFAEKRKHIKQLTTLIPAILLLMGGGMVFGLIMFIPTTIYYQNYQTVFFAGMFFSILVIALLLKKLPKKFFYTASCLLLLISGLISASTYIKFSGRLNTGLLLTGISFGITILTYIFHCSEISIKGFRGLFMGFLQFGIDLGIFIGHCILYTIVNIEKGNDENSVIFIDPYIIIGIFQSIFSILAFINMKFIDFYESPVFLLKVKNDEEAFENIMIIQNELNPADRKVINEIQMMRDYIRYDRSYFTIFFEILICRIVYALGTTLPILVIGFTMNYKALISLYGIKIFMNFIPIFTIDHFGRNILLLISLTCSGILLLITQICVLSGADLWLANLSYSLYTLTLAIGASTVTYTHMSETFVYEYKCLYISLILALECFIHLLVINTVQNSEAFIIITGFLQILTGIGAYVVLPETKGLTLLEAAKIKN